LTLTQDKTDYLWYSSTIGNLGNVTLNFSIASGGPAGGQIYLRIFVNKSDVLFIKDKNNLVSANINLNLDSNSIDILFVSMGLQNWPAPPDLQSGIVSKVSLNPGSIHITNWTHSVGLIGEVQGFLNKFLHYNNNSKILKDISCSMCWKK